MWSVLGIGVAVIVSTSTLFLYSFICSFAFTPNLCSSSIINNPKFLNFTSLLKTLCVPTKISISPSSNFLIISFCSFGVLKRFKISTLIGYSCILSLNSSYCCCASIVVGAKYTTCFWSITALKAALIATSVFPYPTSPHNNLSIGLGFSISFFTSDMQRSWSSVSEYGKLSSNSFCQTVSFEKAYPCIFCLLAYNCINSSATSLKFFFTFSFVLSHSFDPNLFNLGPTFSEPTYLRILSKALVGTYKISSSLYFNFI